jgi:hypothetical protein
MMKKIKIKSKNSDRYDWFEVIMVSILVIMGSAFCTVALIGLAFGIYTAPFVAIPVAIIVSVPFVLKYTSWGHKVMDKIT